ncbi:MULTISPECIES: hypothetical protein [Acinetobacter]|uniref:hypothetical protein n=1 Tax=Acinetobacter TaxID=469 RepID=UPI0014367995|nr:MULTISPECIES: hypothetical protein [Acinetobacter]MCA4815457.1 hypothetical protein [Acinetobacter towneri]QIV91709.1 hypothetical protein GVU25_02305 [Acinetobacter towneri]
MKKKEISLKFSAVALAVLLAGCGGGGSDGYYNKGVSAPTAGTGTGTQEENLFKNIQIQYLPIVEKLNARGDTFTVSVRVMNDGAILPNVALIVESTDVLKNKAAIEYIPSSEEVEGESAGIKTDGQGIARFNVKVDAGLDESTINEILKGVNVKVSVKDDKGNTLASEPHLISAYDPEKEVVEIPNKYDWSILTDKQALAVVGDKIAVQIRLKAINETDSVNNKPVQISLENSFNGQLEISSTSVASTNDEGYVAFTISSKPLNLTEQQISIMLAQGLKFKVQVVESGVVTSEQIKTIDLVKYIDENLYGGDSSGISLGALSANSGKYIQDVHLDLGIDNANQDVTISSRAIQYSKGKYYFSNNIGLYPLSSAICTLNNSPVKNETGLDWNGNSITYAALVSEKLKLASVDVNNVVYLNNEGATNSTLSFIKVKTDADGKATINLIYDQKYSKWLYLSLSARMENQSIPFGKTFDFQLPVRETDYNDQTGTGPNIISPFGISDDCFDAN